MKNFSYQFNKEIEKKMGECLEFWQSYTGKIQAAFEGGTNERDRCIAEMDATLQNMEDVEKHFANEAMRWERMRADFERRRGHFVGCFGMK